MGDDRLGFCWLRINLSQYLLGAYLPTSGPAIESVEKLLEVCSPEEYIRLLADRGMDVGFGAEQPIIAAIGGGIAGIIGGIKNGRGSALGLDKGGKGGGSGGGNSNLIYREGGWIPSNLKPRPQDDGMLSFRDSLSNPWPLPEGELPSLRKEYIVVDTTKLPTGSVIYDNTPPGHVLVRDVPVDVLQKAIVGSGKFPK